MERCGTCKHWNTDPDEYTPIKGFLICGRVPQVDNYEPKGSKPVAKAKKVRALVRDGSGYFAALHTADDFGCTAWEEK